MMKYFFFVLIVSFAKISFAQKESNQISSIDLLVGEKIFQNDFDNQLNSINSFRIESPVHFIGLGITGYNLSVGAHGNVGTQVTFCQILPQKINITDSISATITGNNFSLGFGRDLFRKSELVDMFIFAGFNMGRLRLYGDGTIQQKNFYFSPKLSIQPKVKIGPISLSIRAEYEYDVSDPNWKKMQFSSTPTLFANKFNQSGITCFLSIGYIPN